MNDTDKECELRHIARERNVGENSGRKRTRYKRKEEMGWEGVKRKVRRKKQGK